MDFLLLKKIAAFIAAFQRRLVTGTGLGPTKGLIGIYISQELLIVKLTSVNEPQSVLCQNFYNPIQSTCRSINIFLKAYSTARAELELIES